MRSNDKKEQAAMVAFIGVRIRNLTIDTMGRVAYVEQADDIFEEIFGVKKFASKIVFPASRYDIYGNMERIGTSVLFELCNGWVYDVFSDLIGITTRLDELDRQFKKAKRKDKKIPQRDEKEFKYLHKMYKDSIKKLGKYYNTETGKSYKQRYSALSSFVDKERDYFGSSDVWESRDSYSFGNESLSAYMDDGYGSYSRGYSYYDDDEDGESPFERFIDSSKGSSRGKVKKSRRVEYDDDYDDYEEEEDAFSKYNRNARPTRRSRQDEYEERPVRRRVPIVEEEPEEEPFEDLKETIMKLANVVAHVAKEQKITRGVAENAYDAVASLYEDSEDDDEDEMVNPSNAERAVPKGDVVKNSDIDDIISASMK